jgi:flagellar basal-body rod modification protein FlgD
MTIEGITANSTNATYSNTDTTTNKLGQDDFLTLLLAQLQNQDPLNPMESTEFTSQLAQFTSLEELFEVNDNLVGIQEMLYNQGEEDLLALIGKTIKTNDNTILIAEDSVLSGAYTLDEGADVTISIYDSEGSEIRTLYPGWQDAGEYDIDWDGRDNSGEKTGDGTYYFEVTAKDEAGNYVDINTYIYGEVTGVTYEYGVPYLMIGDRLVSTDQTIIEVTKT